MLHYRVHGSPEQQALVFLHGFMGAADDWTILTRALASDAYCISVDLPGHGGSTGRDLHEYTIEGATQALADVLDDVGVERGTVVGYSMGGRIALCFAAYHPDRVRRLVLESTHPGLDAEEEQMRRREADEARADRILADLDGFLNEWYRQPLFDSLARHDLVDTMTHARLDNDASELARALRGMGTGQQPPLWDAIRDLQIPVLMMAGALDEKYVAISERTAVLNPRVRRVVVPDAGHNIHDERPQAFLAQLVHFLAHT